MDAFPTPLFSLPAEAKKTGGEGPLESGGYGVPTTGAVGRDAEVIGRKAVDYTEHKSSVIEQVSIYTENTGSQASHSLRRDLNIEKATKNPRHSN